MTVTIGAICGVNSPLQTGSIILCADTLISYTDDGGVPISANPSGGKLFDLPLGFFAAMSGDIATGNQVVSYLRQRMAAIPPDRPDRVELIEAAMRETAEYVLLKIRGEVLARHRIALDEFLHDADLPTKWDIREEIGRALTKATFVIAGFSYKGNPTLLYTDCESILPHTRFACAGAGGGAALDWLNMREQNVFMSVPRTVYHVHEAKRFAERSPVVGQRHQVILLRHNQPMVNVGADTPLILNWLSTYMPRLTRELDTADAYADFARTYDVSASTSSSADQT